MLSPVSVKMNPTYNHMLFNSIKIVLLSIGGKGQGFSPEQLCHHTGVGRPQASEKAGQITGLSFFSTLLLPEMRSIKYLRLRNSLFVNKHG